MRLAAYVRVSRDDEQPENQEHAIFRWAAERGHQVVEVVRDVGVSGALPPAQRPPSGTHPIYSYIETAGELKAICGEVEKTRAALGFCLCVVCIYCLHYL